MGSARGALALLTLPRTGRPAHARGGDGARGRRELPRRQPRAAAPASGSTCSRCTASRGWWTNWATPRPPDRPSELAALDWLEGELERTYAGAARHPLLVRLQGTVRECALPREPFLRLIEANRVDQRVARYDTWEQLLGYCHLSADPVGELVLGVFGAATPERVALSDRICTALQLAEHWQDVAEDLRAGRIYLPVGGPGALRLHRARPRPAGRGAGA